MDKKECVQVGAMLGIVLSILVIAIIVAGIYAASFYNQYQNEKSAQIASIKAQGLAECKSMGFGAYDMNKNICFTELSIVIPRSSAVYREESELV